MPRARSVTTLRGDAILPGQNQLTHFVGLRSTEECEQAAESDQFQSTNKERNKL
jgi:hypothetical protein